jgi:hypothetical protein
MLLTVVLVRGIRESAETNNIMVLLKIAAILAFVFVGMRFIHPANYHPFVPEGWSGVLTGGSIIFFTYIGFDSVSTAAEEAQESATRHSHRHHRHAGRLHRALHRRGRRAHRNRALAVADRRRRPGGQQHEHAGGNHQVRAAALDRAGRCCSAP